MTARGVSDDLKSRVSPEALGIIEDSLRTWLTGDAVAVCSAYASKDFPISEAERRYVDNAVHKRQAEFTAGRWCAHRALERIGRTVDTVPIGTLGAPQWPTAVIGSI